MFQGSGKSPEDSKSISRSTAAVPMTAKAAAFSAARTSTHLAGDRDNDDGVWSATSDVEPSTSTDKAVDVESAAVRRQRSNERTTRVSAGRGRLLPSGRSEMSLRKRCIGRPRPHSAVDEIVGERTDLWSSSASGREASNRCISVTPDCDSRQNGGRSASDQRRHGQILKGSIDSGCSSVVSDCSSASLDRLPSSPSTPSGGLCSRRLSVPCADGGRSSNSCCSRARSSWLPEAEVGHGDGEFFIEMSSESGELCSDSVFFRFPIHS
jgi:hypothetical protein